MKKAVAILITALSIALHIPVAAQTEKYEEIASESLQREIVEHLCDSVMEGRGSGTGGGLLARNYILDRFEQLDLRPFYFSRQESFFFNEKISPSINQLCFNGFIHVFDHNYRLLRSTNHTIIKGFRH